MFYCHQIFTVLLFLMSVSFNYFLTMWHFFIVPPYFHSLSLFPLFRLLLSIFLSPRPLPLLSRVIYQSVSNPLVMN